MSYQQVTSTDLDLFRSVVGSEFVLTDSESLNTHSKDHTENLSFPPEVVLQPVKVDEIQKLLAYCNNRKIAVTPRGAGTGLSGGAIPVEGGVSLDLKRMNKILLIDEQNFQVTTEPGVITQTLQESVQAKGLFYPVDPASRGSCFIGETLQKTAVDHEPSNTEQ